MSITSGGSHPLDEQEIASLKAELERVTVELGQFKSSHEQLGQSLADARMAVITRDAELVSTRRLLEEQRTIANGFLELENSISKFIPEHYEAGYNSLEDWATDAARVVGAAQYWRKNRTDAAAATLDMTVEKIYPSEDYA